MLFYLNMHILELYQTVLFLEVFDFLKLAHSQTISNNIELLSYYSHLLEQYHIRLLFI